jgi:hypothetical protein
VKDKIKYWIDLSDYDLDTALAMLSAERFLYVGKVSQSQDARKSLRKLKNFNHGSKRGYKKTSALQGPCV